MEIVSEAAAWVEVQVGRHWLAKVDRGDAEGLSWRVWSLTRNCECRYAATAVILPCGTRQTALMHRMILGAPEGMVVDHVNGDGLDNRRANLRVCRHVENLWNSRKHCKSSSIYKGVSWHSASHKWTAKITVNGRRHSGGYFFDEVDAAKKYDELARIHFGEFANTNF